MGSILWQWEFSDRDPHDDLKVALSRHDHRHALLKLANPSGKGIRAVCQRNGAVQEGEPKGQH